MHINPHELSRYRLAGSEFAKNAVDFLLQANAFSEIKFFDKAHGVSWRVKSDDAIANKISKKDNSCFVNDFIGIRILLPTYSSIQKIESALIPWERKLGLQQTCRQDYFSEQGKNGYRAIHYDYVLHDPNKFNLHHSLGLELQLTTWIQHVFNNFSHITYYKNHPNNIPINSLELENLAEHISKLEAILDKALRDTRMD